MYYLDVFYTNYQYYLYMRIILSLLINSHSILDAKCVSVVQPAANSRLPPACRLNGLPNLLILAYYDAGIHHNTGSTSVVLEYSSTRKLY